MIVYLQFKNQQILQELVMKISQIKGKKSQKNLSQYYFLMWI